MTTSYPKLVGKKFLLTSMDMAQKITLVICYTLVALVCGLGTLHAQGRSVALVIGNGDYENSTVLANSPNDAQLMAATLSDMGFEVDVHLNLTKRNMERVLADFSLSAEQAEVAVVFYAGHGMELANGNYLIPVDAELVRESDARWQAIDLDDVRAAAQGANLLSVVIVDACRNNTFVSSRGGRGLSVVTQMPAEIVAFSTSPGAVALDGSGNNSPYTLALSEALVANPAEDVRILFTTLGERTSFYAGTEQNPYVQIGPMPGPYLSLLGEMESEPSSVGTASDAPPSGPNTSNSLSQSYERALQEWEAISSSENMAVYEAYISRWGELNPVLAAMAQAKLDLLEESEAAQETTSAPEISPIADDEGSPTSMAMQTPHAGAAAQSEWAAIQESQSVAVFQAYFDRWAQVNPVYAALARERIDQLREEPAIEIDWLQPSWCQAASRDVDLLVCENRALSAKQLQFEREINSVSSEAEANQFRSQIAALRTDLTRARFRCSSNVQCAHRAYDSALDDIERLAIEISASTRSYRNAFGCEEPHPSEANTIGAAAQLVELYYRDLNEQNARCAIARWDDPPQSLPGMIANIAQAGTSNVNIIHNRSSRARAFVSLTARVRPHHGDWEYWNLTITTIRTSAGWRIQRMDVNR